MLTFASTLAHKGHSHHTFDYNYFLLRLQNPVSEAAEQRAGQAEEPELVHGVRTCPREGTDGFEITIEEEELDMGQQAANKPVHSPPPEQLRKAVRRQTRRRLTK